MEVAETGRPHKDGRQPWCREQREDEEGASLVPLRHMVKMSIERELIVKESK
jgi:hypothetical protein